MTEPRTTLPGTERPAPAGTTPAGAADPSEQVTISIYLKPEGHTPDVAARPQVYRPALDRLAAFATRAGLTVVEIAPARRLIRVAGTVGDLSAAFGATVGLFQGPSGTFRARTGSLSLPADLAGDVEAVLGLDGRPVASSKLATPAAAVPGHLPTDIARAYGVPVAAALGKGQTVAIVELGGGFLPADTEAAFAAMGLPAPAVTAVSVGGALNTPGGDADGEVALDIQVAGALAPGAHLAVYFAANTAQGFVDAVSQAAHDTVRKPCAISISWGSPESEWSGQTVAAMTSAIADAGTLGVAVCVASGDSLATDGLTDGKAHVDFPASAPGALGCGGTALKGTTETVWNSDGGGTGGGISDQFPVPPYQSGVRLPASVNDGGTRRGVPDVSGDADPNTGYRIVLNGQTQVIGGTSAVAPLWAGLFAALGVRAGAPHAKLYGAGRLRDVTAGNNRVGTIGYDAGPGWDACTGLGSPDWAALSALFGSNGGTAR